MQFSHPEYITTFHLRDIRTIMQTILFYFIASAQYHYWSDTIRLQPTAPLDCHRYLEHDSIWRVLLCFRIVSPFVGYHSLACALLNLKMRRNLRFLSTNSLTSLPVSLSATSSDQHLLSPFWRLRSWTATPASSWPPRYASTFPGLNLHARTQSKVKCPQLTWSCELVTPNSDTTDSS